MTPGDGKTDPIKVGGTPATEEEAPVVDVKVADIKGPTEPIVKKERVEKGGFGR